MNTPLHPNQLRPGHTINRDFRIVRRLGVGGFSYVFLVQHKHGGLYSLKIAARPSTQEDRDKVEDWLRREVASLEYLKHPNLLPVLGWGRWPDPREGYFYFMTPYISGSTFHEWRWHERASLHRAVGVLCEVLAPLAAMHERGICHRDIKADNILVRDGDDKPFLIDFGAVHLPGAAILTEGLAPGTLYCQPPEAVSFLMSGDSRPGSRLRAQPAADLYTVGVLLYETLTNCRPFSARLPLEPLLVAIATAPPPDPELLAPEAPASLRALALRLLSKEPGQRPANARVVREELLRLREEEGHTAAWQAPAQRPDECSRLREQFPGVDVLSAAPPADNGGPLPEPAPRTSGRRGRLLLALLLGVGLLGVAWALFLSEKGTQPMPPSSTSPSRFCLLVTSLLGASTAQLAGCATAPVRPDPIGYLSRCSAEARATPVKLGFKSDENPSFLKSGTPVSHETIEEGGALNLKPGPVTASMFGLVDGKETRVMITGTAVTTPRRVYLQFDRLHLPDGTSLPICGVAVDGKHQYGIPTYAALPMEGTVVDLALVDNSPGSVVLNDPRFETVLQGPEGYGLPPVNLAPPDWR